MVQSNTVSITPATHASRHVIGGEDPLIDPLLLHASRHAPAGADPVPFFTTQSDLTGSRAINTIYRNTTGGAILVVVTTDPVNNDTVEKISVYSNNATPPTTLIASQTGYGANARLSVTFIVLDDNYYKINPDTAQVLISWIEYA